MKLALQLLSFMTVTTVLYLLLSRPKGVTSLGTAATGFITGIQKTAQAR